MALQDASSNDQGSPHSTDLIGAVVGTGVGVVLVAMAAIVIAVGVIKMRRSRIQSLEKLHLLPTFTNNSEL